MDYSIVLEIVVWVVAAWVLLIAILWLVRPRDVQLREVVAVVPDLLRLVRDLLRDRGVPRGPRLALAGLLLWLLNPIDLVPEFIPVLGPLDDVVVAVLVLRYVRRAIGIDGLRAHWRGTDAGFRLLTAIVGTG